VRQAANFSKNIIAHQMPGIKVGERMFDQHRCRMPACLQWQRLYGAQLPAAGRDDESDEKVDNDIDEGADPSSQLADRNAEPEAAQPSELATSSSQGAAGRPAKCRRDWWLP
jgi:hypothetical protein